VSSRGTLWLGHICRVLSRLTVPEGLP
jgi:hypothetical protein